MGYVFISYSSKDQEKADFVCKLLKARNIDYWIATNNIATGENYAKVIPSAIKQCACAILLLSEASQQSVYVSNEIDRLINQKKPIFPIKLENCQLNDEFDFYLCRSQIINAFNITEDTPTLESVFDAITILTNEGKLLLEIPQTIGIPDELESSETSAIEDVLADYKLPCKYTGQKFVGRLLVRYYFDHQLTFDQLTKIQRLTQDIQIRLRRQESPNISVENIKGKNLLCIELPRLDRQIVRWQEVFDVFTLKNQGKLVFPLGVDFDNKIKFVDIAKDNSILIAGNTGSGKSQVLYNVITSLITAYTPDQVKLLLIDPKWVELSQFATIPHLLQEIVTDPSHYFEPLQKLYRLVNSRHSMFHKVGKRNIDEYNAVADKKMERIVVIIDELADLFNLDTEKTQKCLSHLEQKSKSAGIHIIATTQRASFVKNAKILEEVFPSKIALRMSSFVDSKDFIGDSGAEKLTSFGDLYYNSPIDNTLVRLQAPYVSYEIISQQAEKAQQST